VFSTKINVYTSFLEKTRRDLQYACMCVKFCKAGFIPSVLLAQAEKLLNELY